ncbi:OmpA family protein [Erythrobacter sp.]|uniref:OmpA family protein n=1 Tax=Erythrobacter sp. TaxID=1042 RepID=UPI001425BC38|nr:OmpA family protein [Erythrobacter sp.]QIQ87648.1 MAG: OmpA family protein [Erythrobacter sp.]
MRTTKTLAPLALAPILALALAACQDRTDDAEDPQSASTSEADAAEEDEEEPAPVSILRPDIEPPELPDLPEVPLEPLDLTIGFPEGGMELDEEAKATLEQVLESEQVATGAPIVLRSHTDSEGSDTGNMRASEKRGELVKAWLVENGIAADRIRVIPFGEQNPVAPNALPDGSPNEAGRARNRRVEVAVVPVPEETVPDDPADASAEDAD